MAPIHDAAIRGDVSKVRALLQADFLARAASLEVDRVTRARARSKAEKKLRKLTKAAALEVDAEAKAEAEAEARVNINAKNNRGWTPLHQAAKNGHKEVAECLIEAAKEFLRKEEEEKEGSTGSTSTTSRSSFSFESFINAKDDYDGRTPLHWAAYRGYKEVVECLIEEVKEFLRQEEEEEGSTGSTSNTSRSSSFSFESFINAKAFRGYTPLHLAAQEGKKEVVECLIEVTKEFLKKEEEKEGSTGSTSTTRSSFSFESFINAKDDYDGRTPLHWAAYRGYKEVVECLIEEVKEFIRQEEEEEGSTGSTSTTSSSSFSFESFINAKNTYDSTPLHSAAFNGDKEVVECLIEAAKWFLRKEEEKEEGSTSTTRSSFSFESFINAKMNFDGMTPLHYAAKNGHKEIVECLIEEAKEEILRKEEEKKEGSTSTTRSSSFSFESFINAKDKYGKTPLHWAAEEGHKEIALFLVQERNKALFKLFLHAPVGALRTAIVHTEEIWSEICRYSFY